MVASKSLIAAASVLVALTSTTMCPDPKTRLRAPLDDKFGSGPMAAARAMGRWSRSEAPDAESLRELVFVLKQRNASDLHGLLMERSNPRSASYGQWLTASEVREMTRNRAGEEKLRAELKKIGADVLRISKGGELLRAKAPLATWEGLLDTTFHLYASSRFDSSHVAAESFTIPEDLREHVSGLLGCVDFPTQHQVQLRSTVATSGKLTPETLRQAYGLPNVAAQGSEEAESQRNATQAVFASLDQYWSMSDAKQFQQEYSLPETAVKELDDGNHSDDTVCVSDPNNCGEANLDVQYMQAMSPWSQMGFWYTDDDFTGFLEALADVEDPPEVISISYGGFEVQHSAEQIQVFDGLAQKLGLMGVTLIASSGDDGAQGGLWNDKDKDCSDTDQYGLQVSWPAASQYVTAVGATAGIEDGRNEVICQISCSNSDFAKTRKCTPDPTGPLITSGGGISAVTAKPDWQGDQNPCQYRGIPDVALAGHSYNVVVGGQDVAVDGTSASAPVFGGIVALVNARRKSLGKPTVGFVNPAMYQNPEAFKDIIEGSNVCGGAGSSDGESIPCCGGYYARIGWDAATGLGSIDFPKFEAIFDSSSPQAMVV